MCACVCNSMKVFSWDNIMKAGWMLLTHSLSLLHHSCKTSCAIFTLIQSGVRQESSEFLRYILNNKPIVKKIPIKLVNIMRIYGIVQKEITSQAVEACQNLPSGSQVVTSKLVHSQIFRRKESKISLGKCKWFGGKC